MFSLRTFFITLLFFSTTAVAAAYSIEPVEVDNNIDRIEITDPTKLRQYYGVLEGMPHTFIMRLREEANVSLSLIVPDLETIPANLSLLVVKEAARGVELVQRVSFSDAEWEEVRTDWSKTKNKQGPTYTASLQPGVYIIEISSPDNIGKYIFSSGTEETQVGYFEKLRALTEMQRFHERSAFHIVKSPLVYVPLAVIMFAVFVLVRVFIQRRKEKREAGGIVHR